MPLGFLSLSPAGWPQEGLPEEPLCFSVEELIAQGLFSFKRPLASQKPLSSSAWPRQPGWFNFVPDSPVYGARIFT